MEQQLVSPPAPGAGMCGSDREIFERVWRRVMPLAGEGCPIQLSPPEQGPPALRAEERGELAVSAPAPEREEQELCLGPSSAGAGARLREMIEGEMEDERLYLSLARRAGGAAGRALGALAGEERRHIRRLGTAYFLITGERCQPRGQGGGRPRTGVMEGLREQFIQEQRESRAYRLAAAECADPCLKELYLELAEDETLHARLIRNLLEQM